MNRRNFLRGCLSLLALPVAALAVPARPRSKVIIHGLDPNKLFQNGAIGSLADTMMARGANEHCRTIRIKIDPPPVPQWLLDRLEADLKKTT